VSFNEGSVAPGINVINVHQRISFEPCGAAS
jgi:hypothetical protein